LYERERKLMKVMMTELDIVVVKIKMRAPKWAPEGIDAHAVT
jgi:hypothetical protein